MLLEEVYKIIESYLLKIEKIKRIINGKTYFISNC